MKKKNKKIGATRVSIFKLLKFQLQPLSQQCEKSVQIERVRIDGARDKESFLFFRIRGRIIHGTRKELVER